MKNLISYPTSFALLFFISTAQANLVNISLSPSDWHLSTYTAQDTPPPTLTQIDSNLRGTVLTANTGSPYGMEVETNNSYNFQNSTLRFQWRVQGLDSYSQASTSLISTDGTIRHKISSNGGDSSFTTDHSFAGSQTIADNTWLFTEIIYTPTGLDFSVSYNGYNAAPISSGTNAYDPIIWDRLNNAAFRFRLVDNYKENQYFEISEMSLENSGLVPIPASLFLFGSALFGLIGLKQKEK